MEVNRSLRLFVISFLSLYFEMFCIRFVSSQVQIIGYYTNLVLIACFLGLGVGCLLTRHKARLMDFFPLLLLLTIGISCLFKNVMVRGAGMGLEVIYLHYQQVSFSMNIFLMVALFYMVIAVTFVPAGQEIARLFNELPPLKGYTVNIMGSIAGTLCFGIFSFFQLSPTCWLLLVSPLLISLYWKQRPVVWGNALLVIASIAIMFVSDKDAIWSPYHKITTAPLTCSKDGTEFHRFNRKAGDIELPLTMGFNIFVSGKSYQTPFNLTDSACEKFGWLKLWQKHQDIPYKYGRKDDVLIVGGGSGNDASAAVRNKCRNIDVVDIEPVFIRFGKTIHPEKPYAQPHVRAYADDARSFFHKTAKSYDMIVFGFLDSQAVFSSMSNIRQDSYVYTVECFMEARKHLKSDGVIAVCFGPTFQWNVDRLCIMVQKAFNQAPLVLRSELPGPGLGITLICGPGIRDLSLPDCSETAVDLRPATDDWPFFYLRDNAVPGTYTVALIIIFSISALMVYLAHRGTRSGVEPHFFLLGSAFMLLETKSITSMALLFGTTWLTNSIVILSILIMILLANVYVLKRPIIKVETCYVLLAGALLLNFLVPLKSLQCDNVALKLVLSSLLVSCPLFFAGIIFACSFKDVTEPDYALGSNILGGVAGAVLEYQSLVTGFHYLFILIFFVYALSYLFYRRARQ